VNELRWLEGEEKAGTYQMQTTPKKGEEKDRYKTNKVA